MITADDVRLRMRHAIADAGGRQNVWAAQVGVTPGLVSMVLRGDREPGERILCALGLQRVKLYEVLR